MIMIILTIFTMFEPLSINIWNFQVKKIIWHNKILKIFQDKKSYRDALMNWIFFNFKSLKKYWKVPPSLSFGKRGGGGLEPKKCQKNVSALYARTIQQFGVCTSSLSYYYFSRLHLYSSSAGYFIIPKKFCNRHMLLIFIFIEKKIH